MSDSLPAPDTPDSPRDSAERAYNLLLAVLDEALTSPDPESSVRLIVDVVRACAELRARAERRLGLMLSHYPDPGGRPSGGSPTPMHRRIRRAITVDRNHLAALRRLADVRPEVFELLMDQAWDGYPRGGCVARALAREAVELEAKATPSELAEGD